MTNKGRSQITTSARDTVYIEFTKEAEGQIPSFREYSKLRNLKKGGETISYMHESFYILLTKSYHNGTCECVIVQIIYLGLTLLKHIALPSAIQIVSMILIMI